MEGNPAALFFLSAGLFMGWSLGANDAANIMGTAVSTKMIKFRSAALIISVFVALGALISGAGTTKTLGELGDIVRLEEAFMASLAAALVVMVMTKNGLPVSTSQSIIGSIIGWNLYHGHTIDWSLLIRIAGTWVFAPVLGAVMAMVLFVIFAYIWKVLPVHIVRRDQWLRIALVIAGAFGAYSLGANNMANVMGVFVNSLNLPPLTLNTITVLNGQQMLFLLGAISVSVGVYTYSMKVMSTIGTGIMRLAPAHALIIVLSSALVLFLFASQNLQAWLISHNLPSFPLVPVSQSQAVVGSVVGIGIAKGGRNIKLALLGKIFLGWVITPVASIIVVFFLLTFS
ncbi:inorganic phosphate transporter, PiT family [Tindallia magadiensis]|uniref:Inorganic phosphate transporter, PiT family n=1 Tax=Tindallia magadiensis TaxID=69895 RepID=A0A1I3AVY1_9FIRM|nr:inorganic phosphate transporter [Tindallia magadiensis]SFH53909.1 inorganic phosphate transporter, PiT family [Tindallia magadiensis]